MLMSHAATSSAGARWPRPGPRVGAGASEDVAQAASSADTARIPANRSAVYIAHTPVRRDAPGLDGMAVIGLSRRVARDPRGPRRLHVALFVGGPALQRRGRAVPLPRQPEAREALREYRSLQDCFLPGRAAVGGDLDFRDPALARPRQAGNLVPAAAVEVAPERRERDEGLDALHESELVRLSVGQEIRVLGG